MKLKKLIGNTYYIEAPVNIGVIVNEDRVTLIDSGNGKDSAKKILKIIEEHGWKIDKILNTHSHADHIGGNNFLQSKTDVDILAPKSEDSIIENPIMEPAFLWGAKPFNALRNKFLEAKPSKINQSIDEGIIPGTDIRAVSLNGHCMNMQGYITADGVFFIADAVISENLINKYGTFYLYDVEEYQKSLDKILNIKANIYMPCHGDPMNQKEIVEVINANKNKIDEISNHILKSLYKPKIFENILADICNEYNIQLNASQYVLQGASVKAYISYLCDKGKITNRFENGYMFWENTK